MSSDRDLERQQADNNCCLIAYFLFLFGIIIGLFAGFCIGLVIGSDEKGGKIHEHSLNFLGQIFIIPKSGILKDAAT